MSKVEVGKVVNTRGLRGEIKVYPLIDELEAFNEFEYLLIKDTRYNIKGVKFFKNMVFVTLEGVDTIEKAEALKNYSCELYEEDLPELSEGEFYIKDILGMEVITDEGVLLGIVSDVLRTGSNDVYEVKCQGKKPMYIPAIKDVVLDYNIPEGKMTVHIIPGLDEL
ncbi:MAG: 16S rRNA processing protein RimM [Ruminococcaceae bacterium]|nr:16S rRNA processing protein RimM [Oscillospiraceae bacterium]